MNRRFKSLTSFSQALQSLTPEEVSRKVSKKHLSISPGGKDELYFVGDILYSADADTLKAEYPYLYKHWRTTSQPIYDGKSAWEFHKLFVYTFTLAQRHVASLTSALKLPASISKISVCTTSIWITYLHKLIHHSPIFQAHIGALESLVAKKMKAAMKTWVSDPPVPNEDFDGGQDDIDLEMDIERETSPSGMLQQALWLLVSYQQAMEVVTDYHALPKPRVSLKFWEPPVEIVPLRAACSQTERRVYSLY